MTTLSRRTILQAGAGAAVAVPMTLLATRTASMTSSGATVPSSAGISVGSVTAAEPVVFCVHDAATGEVSVLHGTNEVIVRDTGLVSRILAAVAAVPSSRVVAATTTNI